jgi:hypothetical protein
LNNVKDGHKNKQSYANKRTGEGKEQYYTNPDVVDICVAEAQKHIDLSDRTILEPAGGTGEFIKGFYRAGLQDVISFDIEPKYRDVLEADFLSLKDVGSGLVCITNPPFGRMNSISVPFFNHAAKFCDYVCFLVPKSWRKWTTINRLDDSFHLVADIEMPQDCFYLPEGETKKGVLQTVFQVWEKRTEKREQIKVPDHKLIKKITKPTDGIVRGANFALLQFGHGCGKVWDISGDVNYKTTTMYLHVDRQDVKDALKEIDFSEFANRTAYVEALSIQEINYKLNERFGLPNYTGIY